jgi:hypothetical protein
MKSRQYPPVPMLSPGFIRSLCFSQFVLTILFLCFRKFSVFSVVVSDTHWFVLCGELRAHCFLFALSEGFDAAGLQYCTRIARPSIKTFTISWSPSFPFSEKEIDRGIKTQGKERISQKANCLHDDITYQKVEGDSCRSYFFWENNLAVWAVSSISRSNKDLS